MEDDFADDDELYEENDEKMKKGEIRFEDNNQHSLYQRLVFNLSAPIRINEDQQ